MRVAAIVGRNTSSKYLNEFQKNSHAEWSLTMPQKSSEADAVAIFGGDGTIHHYLPQLVELTLPTLIVPCGSGNDFARSLGLRNVKSALWAWQKFIQTQANVHSIDLGTIQELSRNQPSYFFCCAGGVGIDGEIARGANALPRWIRGHGGYALSLIPALINYSPLPLRISHSGSDGSTRSTISAIFANSPYYGGGMKIAPHAQFDDGKLDLCVIRDLSKLQLLAVFPSIYFGSHLRLPQVEYSQLCQFLLETEAPHPVYADGEYICQTPIAVSVAARALPVIVP